MSNAIFPTFDGLKWDVTRTPVWKTAVRETTSGREYRTAFQAAPRYLYKLAYEVLRETVGYTELQSLLGFFNARQGAFDSFLYTDPDDNSVTAQVFGTGNGSTTQFQLLRTLGAFNEPVYDTNSTPLIYDNGSLRTVTTHYTINATGLVTFVTAPVAGHSLTWTGTYYWRVRFRQDQTEFTQFMQKLWSTKSVEFITVKP
jgi:uncharacterized protein (TIGR02217 family)